MVMIAVGRRHISQPVPWIQVVFAHQATDLLGVHHEAAVPQFGGHPTIAVGLELVRDRLHLADDLRIIRPVGGRRIEAGARDPHQPASLRDAEAGGPVITDVGPLLIDRAERISIFKNSSSSA